MDSVAEGNLPYRLWGMMENTISDFSLVAAPQNLFQMIYVRGGTAVATCHNFNCHIEKGYLLCLHSGMAVLIHASEQPFTFTSFLISGISDSIPVISRLSPGSEAEQQISKLSQYCLAAKPGCAVPWLNDLLQILCHSKPMERTFFHQPQICSLKKIIDEHCGEQLCLEQFAKKLHTNKYKIIKDFKARYGMPPIQYLIHSRIHKACSLLCETDKSISEIGAEVGMDNTPYFIRTFKKVIGCTPNAFRKSLQNEM